MKGYKLHNGTVEVPKDSGVEGFLTAIRKVLELPRLTVINVDARGKVSYSYFLREGEEARTPAVNFDEVMPYATIRNAEVKEIQYAHENAAVATAQMFQALSVDHLSPVAFVAGANSWLWRWYKETTNVNLLVHDEYYGLPVYTDRHIEDSSLVLCGAYGRESVFADTVRSYKISIPKELT